MEYHRWISPLVAGVALAAAVGFGAARLVDGPTGYSRDALAAPLASPGQDNASSEYQCTDGGTGLRRLIVRIDSVVRADHALSLHFTTFTDASTAEVYGDTSQDLRLTPEETNAQIVDRAKELLTEQCGSDFSGGADVLMFGGASTS